MRNATRQVLALKVEDMLRRHGGASSRAILRSLGYLSGQPLDKLDSALQISLYFPKSAIARPMLAAARTQAILANERLDLQDSVSIIRAAIIKPCVSLAEPGFLLVSFESELGKLARLRKFPELEKQYRILFLPSWQPFHSRELSLFDARATKPYFIMPSSLFDSGLVADFSSKANYLPFHAASWVNADKYSGVKRAAERDIDLLMIANFSRRKRHWRLFEIMARLPHSVACTVAGVATEKRDTQSLSQEAALFGVESQITIVEGTTDAGLRELLARSKLFCAMSTKEGSYIAVVEALMAGVPVAMSRTANVGSRAYINSDTGFFFDDNKKAPGQIADAIANSGKLDPRKWAMANISAQVNSQKLNSELQAWSLKEGLSWTTNIMPFFCERFNFKNLIEADTVARKGLEAQLKFSTGLELR